MITDFCFLVAGLTLVITQDNNGVIERKNWAGVWWWYSGECSAQCSGVGRGVYWGL